MWKCTLEQSFTYLFPYLPSGTDWSFHRRREHQSQQSCPSPQCLGMILMMKWVNFLSCHGNQPDVVTQKKQLLSIYIELLCFILQTSVGESLQREAIKKKMMKQVRVKIKNVTTCLVFFFFQQLTLCNLHFFFLCSLSLKTRLEMQKALEQDSTVYDYDAVYDDMQKQKLESNKNILGGADRKVISVMLNTWKYMEPLHLTGSICVLLLQEK